MTAAPPTCVRSNAGLSRVFSGTANGRRYRADLELQAGIDAASCGWEMRCNEPVLKLVKQQPGHWDRFSRTKVEEPRLLAVSC